MFKLPSLQPVLFIAVFCCAITTFQNNLQAQSQFEANSGFVEDVVLGDLPPSTGVAFGPDNRIFIAIKDGIIRVAQNGVLLPTPFIDISSMVNRHTDRGLGGMAIDPQFPARPYVYLFFTYDPPGYVADDSTPRVSRLIRVQADPAQNYNVAKADTTEIILGKNSVPANIASQLANGSTIVPEPASCMTGLTMDGAPIEDCIPSDERSHTAGTLIFGGDGSLYVSHGDGAPYSGATKVQLRSQNLDSLAGKVMRIDPNTGLGLPGNPYYDATKPNANRSRVWAYGMRNPFRITVNPANGQVYVGDVGSSTWEEINVGKGSNFGWPCYEGGTSDAVDVATVGSGNTLSAPNKSYQAFSRTKPYCSALSLSAVTAPLFSYKHRLDAAGNDLGASVTGVAFYGGNAYPPEKRGALFIADYAQHLVRYLTFNANGIPTVHPFATETAPGAGVVQLSTGPDTNIYGLFLNLVTKKSQLRRFRYTGSSNTPPTVVLHASPTAGSTPLVVNFDTAGTNDPDGQAVSYAWDFGDGTSSTETSANPTHTYTTVGTFEATLIVKELTAPFAESTASINIRTGVTPPRVHINFPTNETTYQIGETIPFSGYAEYNGATIPVSNLSWSVIQQHNQHEHLVAELPGVNSGSFQPTEHSDNTRYMLCLYASVGAGQDDQACVLMQPRTTEVTFASDPVGATIEYIDEDLAALAPYIAHPIVNSQQTISASPTYDNRSFAGWSDGVTTAERNFTTGNDPVTFKALYQNTPPTAKMVTSSTGGVAPVTIQFDGSMSTDLESTALTYAWDFGNQDSADTATVSRTFTTAGVYPVKLTVTDPLGLTGDVSKTITILDASAENTAPSVVPPAPITAKFGDPITLGGVVTDDGLPYGSLDTLWSRVRGPGTVTFGNMAAPSTAASFTLPGTYLLKLEATDSQLRTSLNTSVTLNPVNPAFSVTSFSLINSDTDQVIPGYEAIQNGATIVLKGLGATSLNVRANTSGSGIGSVVFMQDAQVSGTDNTAPFALQPSTGADYPAWAYTKKRYLVTAVPYAGSAGTGASGAALSIQFTIKDSVAAVVPTSTPVATATAIVTATATATVTSTATPSATATGTATPTASSTATATMTATPVVTATVAATATQTATPTATNTPQPTATLTAIPTATSTATATNTVIPTATITNTPQPTVTATATPTATGTATATKTAIPTATNTPLPTFTPTAMSTATPTINPSSANQAPNVDPGLAQTVVYGSSVHFVGTSTDDGLPSGSLSTTWTRVRGPGTVSFSSPNTAGTDASFSLPGTYMVKIAGSDGVLQTTKNGIISLNPANPSFGVTSITLINAVTGLPFAGYEQVANGATINISSLGTSPQINIRANTTGAGINSVRWLSDADTLSTDNNAPFAIQPTTGGSYGAWAYSKKLWRVTAVPFSAANAAGTQGAALSIQFTLK